MRYAVKAKIEKALSDGQAKIKAAEETMAKHAEVAKAKNPEVFGRMEKAVAVCQDKLGAAMKAFNSATDMLKDNAESMSAIRGGRGG